jgi:hypothetical protein
MRVGRHHEVVHRVRRFQRTQSIFDGETLPDLIDPLIERIEAGVKASVMQVEYISRGYKSENPVVTFHVDDHLLDSVAYGNDNVPQNIHCIPRLDKMTFRL